MKYKNLKIIALSLLISSCSNFVDTDKSMGSWLGEDINTVIQNWGYPDEEKTIAGKKLIVWKSKRVVQDIDYISNRRSVFDDRYNNSLIPSSYRNDRVYSNYSVECKRIFEINKNDEIIGWDIKGNDCAYLDDISMANPNSELIKKIKEIKK